MGLDEAIDLLHTEPPPWRRVDRSGDERRVRRLVLPSFVRERTLWRGGRVVVVMMILGVVCVCGEVGGGQHLGSKYTTRDAFLD